MAVSLLPPGCYDVLPPFAQREADTVQRLATAFESYGYALTAPTLVEYTETLLAGRGAALSSQVCRLMDAGGHKVMGIRADITLQIARIAATRLANAPLPLRLSYAGQVLRTQGEKGRGSRQFFQAGIELIGPASPEADAEVIIVAADALMRAGVPAFSIDLNMPEVVGILLAEEALEEPALLAILQAIAHKDASALAAYPLKHGHLIAQLVAASGPAETALPALRRLPLPESARASLRALETVAAHLRAALPPSVSLTVDITESRGMEYHTGVTVSFFAPGSPAEIGAGGRYRIDADGLRREATGVTLYVGAVCRLLPDAAPARRIFMAVPADYGTVRAWQEQGMMTVHALPDYGHSHDDARRMGCTHYFAGGALTEL